MKRREKGTGTVFQRPDGRWVAMITLEDGKRKSYASRDESVVRAKLRDALRLQEQGKLVIGSSMKLGDYLAWWLENVASLSIRHNTVSSYRAAISVSPELGRVQLRHLKTHHIQSWVRDSLRSRSAVTVRKHLGVVHLALDYAVEIKFIGENVTDRVKGPKGSSGERRSLEPEQAHLLLDSTRGKDDHTLWAIMLSTGMRVGEALALYWPDIDLKARLLTVSHTLEYRPHDGCYRMPTKTHRSQRSIDLADQDVSVLQSWKIRQAERRLSVGPDWTNPQLVFTLDGDPRPGYTVTNALRRDLRAAGLPVFSPHDLRHTAATLMLRSGTPAGVVAERLGHASSALTVSTYGHVQPTMQRKAAEDLAAVLWGA